VYNFPPKFHAKINTHKIYDHLKRREILLENYTQDTKSPAKNSRKIFIYIYVQMLGEQNIYKKVQMFEGQYLVNP